MRSDFNFRQAIARACIGKMMTHIYDEADLLTVLSRLSARYLRLLKVPASRSPQQIELSANGKLLLSAFGSSCE